VKFPELERPAGKFMNNYSLGDFLIRVKNASMAGQKDVVATPKNKLILSAAKALKEAGFIDKIAEKDGQLLVALTFKDKKPMMMGLTLISRPGLRIYMKSNEIAKKKGPATLIISTPKGIVTSKRAVKEVLGGEVIAEIW
jgi:small subunit ribosomal protein S8